MRTLFLGLLALTLTTSSSFASTFIADPDRTVYIRGFVGDNAVKAAADINVLSLKSKRPIDIVLNSPGGSIMAGLQTISAMVVAQNRGVTIRCLVPMLAASMAFQIFSHCDERYSLANTMLLFHPATIGLRGGTNADDLLYYGNRLRRLEIPLANHLIKVMGLTRQRFFYHYRHETLWLAKELRKETAFFTIISDFANVDRPFDTN